MSNSGGLLDIVDNSCGYVFDKEQFETSLLNVINNVELDTLIVKGNNGYKLISEKKEYNSEYYLDNFKKILDDKWINGDEYEKKNINIKSRKHK